jgi:type II restriction/modification system DNA methylase subunit YeeA
MNRNKLKTYAPQARRDFIQAVTDRATQFGLTATKIEPMTEQGEVVLIGGRPFPKSVGAKRKKLEARIQKLGFGQTMEAMAYTWFNRIVAIRFMELHGYLEHGFRVLSHPAGHTQPEILEHAQHVDLPGLDQKKVVELKLDGTKEEELYRLLLLAQCNALHKALPFLFESIDDETELLLPDLLLHSDSLIRNLVKGIDEDDWQEVEIIGWLYQFYISDKKDEVIGKVVASEDIPAATQLFTPNWIVKYLVQNTLGRQWLATYPQSALRQQMEYYIEPAEQTPEVQEQLKAITPTSLNPEELTLLDPACGSGHILVEAYDLFKAIYQERGYRTKDIPPLILTKNLFGFEIDDRATQLAAFTLMMKARADAVRIFDSEAKPNILSFEDSQGMNAADITHALNSPILKEPMPPKEGLFEEIEEEKAGLFSKKSLAEKGHVSHGDIASLLELFENAKTIGSLIQVPLKLAAKLPEIEQRLNNTTKHGDLTHSPANVIKSLIHQARCLARQFDAVVANPPYMGVKGMNSVLSAFSKTYYAASKTNLFAMFMERVFAFTLPHGSHGMVTMQSWMFLSSLETLRSTMLKTSAILTMAHLGPRAFNTISGEVVQVSAFACMKCKCEGYKPVFYRLLDGDEEVKRAMFLAGKNRYSHSTQSDFESLPGSPIAYWLSQNAIRAFIEATPLQQLILPRAGMITCDNDRFIRLWHEVSIDKIGFDRLSREHAQESRMRWFPYQKGGSFRKWYGNHEYVVNWENDGWLLRTTTDEHGKVPAHAFNDEFIFKTSITWSDINSVVPSFRLTPVGHLFDAKGPSAFCESSRTLESVLAVLNSSLSPLFMKALNPTISFQAGNFADLPIRLLPDSATVAADVQSAVSIARCDWDTFETSWDFKQLPVFQHKATTLEQSQSESDAEYEGRFCLLKDIEQKNNRRFIEAYGLQSELSPDVPDDQITLYRPNREEDIKRLISYAIGCIMGRFSLNQPGLIYAHDGNQSFDPSHYTIFPVDEDGILPVTDFTWFSDDAANRFEKFIATAWPAERLGENLKFVSESLTPKKGESPQETIRRYLAADFYKYHLSMYKKRPIYWLFSSGKQRGFQALVYLHRYNEGTLARMRTEYVIPLLGKMTARIEHLADEIASTSSSQRRKSLETEKNTVTRQRAEVQSFDEKVRHHADQRVKLDLDDGVKVNYGKFGNLLAEVKSVAGGNPDE